MINPFITNGYAGAEYFCDRIQETKEIKSLLINENNIALISPRRLGKTELICHIFNDETIRKDYYTFIVDIYATKNLNDFVKIFGKMVFDELRPKGKSAWEKFINIVSSLKSDISFDMNGNPTWSVGLGDITNPATTLDEIFKYLNSADKPCLVAIDEFQQITKYDDKTIEATLRTHIQKSVNAHFIFSGSQRHLMNGIFTSPSRPFYQSVTIMNLQPIPLDKYVSFAQDKFEQAGKDLSKDVVESLYNTFEGITSYIHRILNVLFSKTERGETCTTDMVPDAIDFIIRMSSDTYETLLYQMPEKQKSTFLAIANAKQAKEITGSAFIKKHKLPSASSVTSAVKGLLDKDFITCDKGVYSVYDQFFVLWLVHKGFIK